MKTSYALPKRIVPLRLSSPNLSLTVKSWLFSQQDMQEQEWDMGAATWMGIVLYAHETARFGLASSLQQVATLQTTHDFVRTQCFVAC